MDGESCFLRAVGMDDAEEDPEEAELQAEMQGMELKYRGAHLRRTAYSASRSVSGVAPIPGGLFFSRYFRTECCR